MTAPGEVVELRILNVVDNPQYPAYNLAGYFDADRNYIKIYACDQSEYSDLLKFVHQKEDAVARAEARANDAARKAAKDARSAVMRTAKV